MRLRFLCRFFLLLIAATLDGACASTGGTPKPFPTPNAPSAPGPLPSAPAIGTTSPIGYSVAGTALSLRGTPYRNGGSDPTGFDCSGFVRYVFAAHGVNVPRTVAELARAGRTVADDKIQPGDLVFFTTVAKGASHVGIAIGGDEFVHAPSSTGEVRVERLSASYWATRFVGARRVL
jgi:cell wall-associated NlpC family hydrolase